MKNFEKLGLFYLGKIFNPKKKAVTDELLLYESKNFTTHAVCVGMTGSGKTGLGIVILEEAALDKIPSIVIDPKGDLGNLLLTFPKLSTNDFLPWIDEAEAERQGMDRKKYAETVAKTWKEGLTQWGENSERIKKLKDSVEMVIYTPASNEGIPLSILTSFAAPTDDYPIRDRVQSVVSSLLGLVGIHADPIKSKEHILLSNIFTHAWEEGKDLDIETLIKEVQNPSFDKIGALNIDTFFPKKERMALSISLNNLLAAPGFHAWMEGEPLDIGNLLYTKEGKPKLSILSIAHLSEAERMFFVTLLLNELLGWMRRQTGTSSLRALFYMDEIFGYFPPTAMPPSKIPMLTLLKQARAYGLGIMLCTQNPVDLDYKGLSNCGTWFIGKLQTERDKSRVLSGLDLASNGEMDTKTLDKMIESIGKRIFIMRSVYEKEPLIFQTRWTMSYLRGPITLAQIKELNGPQENIIKPKEKIGGEKSKPNLPEGIPEFFVHLPGRTKNITYQPKIGGFAKLHFVDLKKKIDVWKEVSLLVGVDGKTIDWDHAKNVIDLKDFLEQKPLPNSQFASLPSTLMQEKNYPLFSKSLAAALYQNHTLNIYQYPELNLISEQGESENEFRNRVLITLREKRDEQIQKIKDKYGQKISNLKDRLSRAEGKVSTQKQQAGIQKAEAYISVGATILGAIFGRKKVSKGTISDAGTTMRRMGKIGKENQEAERAESDYNTLKSKLGELQLELDTEIGKMSGIKDSSELKIEKISVRPRKSDIDVQQVALVWWPNS